MGFEREFPGPNYGYVLELYERYLENPDSVDEASRSLFNQWKPAQRESTIQGRADLGKLIGVVGLVQAIRSRGVPERFLRWAPGRMHHRTREL
jgi:2-oxoglutarate dehydrogenase E1 component